MTWSSSPEARVYALGAEGPGSSALFAKTAAAGTLSHEARMSTAFHELGLGPEVVEYLPGDDTHAEPGERDGDLFAEFAGAEEQCAGGMFAVRCAQSTILICHASHIATGGAQRTRAVHMRRALTCAMVRLNFHVRSKER